MKDQLKEIIEKAEANNLIWYLQFGDVRICNPDGDDYYYYGDD